MTPSQSNMPIKGNAQKTSFQHLELIYPASKEGVCVLMHAFNLDDIYYGL